MSHFQTRESAAEALLLLSHIAAAAESHYKPQEIRLHIPRHDPTEEDSINLMVGDQWIAGIERFEPRSTRWVINILPELIPLI